MSLIGQQYYDPGVDLRKLTNSGLDGVVKGLKDPFTEYLTPEEYRRQQDLYTGQHRGIIGISVINQGGVSVIHAVLPNSPAQRAGLHQGDVLLEIGGKKVAGLNGAEVTDLIISSSGDSVKLTVERAGKQLESVIKRQIFTTPTVQSTHLAHRVLYLRIYQFGDSTSKEFDDQLRAGLPGSSGVILDLRGNGGGLVTAATSVISRFVDSGEALETRGRSGVEKTEVSGDHPAALLPVVVLIDGDTASASEIVAGSLSVHHRAQLVGEKSFGKGSVQEDYPLAGGGDLHLTVEHWFLPDGRSVDHQGLKPDIEVPLSSTQPMFDVAEKGSDPAQDAQLSRALALVTGP